MSCRAPKLGSIVSSGLSRWHTTCWAMQRQGRDVNRVLVCTLELWLVPALDYSYLLFCLLASGCKGVCAVAACLWIVHAED